MLGRVRVAGHSMEPALHHGDELLFINVPPRIGSVVVKRVAAIERDDLILESDAPAHETLLVDRRALLGRAILRYRPFNRTSAVPGRAARHTRARGCC